jgi:16S rRNA (adenine1518-N6/adenine1519-N6)-dimethyltransferase
VQARSKLAGTDRAVYSRIFAIILKMRKSGPRSIGDNQLDGLPPLREVTAAHGLLAKKSLGQNFLFDLNLTRRIARTAAPLTTATIVEIGPGPGGLTRALLTEGAQKVIAVERDARCLAALAEIANHYPGRLEIVEGDALEVDLAKLVGEARPARVCANLPYHIATALLIRWLETEPWPPWFDRLTLMFQREVAERIVATPAERAAYGRLAVLCNWRCETRILFDVAASAFTPPPCDARLLSEVTQAAFGQRRKMLRQSLKSLTGGDAMSLLAHACIDPVLRAEAIGIDGFVALARALACARARQASPSPKP